MNTIKYADLKAWYLNNDTAKQNAMDYFTGKPQPSIYQTGFYSAPSWNWGYIIGIAKANGKLFEVVTQFGHVTAAREIHLTEVK